jgi:hypothetical protein
MLNTLMLTSSRDATAAMLTPHFAGTVTRLDLDGLPAGDFLLHADGFRLNGNEFSLADFTAVYWRKPADPVFEVEHVDQLQEFEYLQRLYAFRAISRLARRNHTWHLIDPLHELHCPKPFQLTVARQFFAIPPWGVFTGAARPKWTPVVTKAMSPSPVKDGRYLATKRIANPSDLSPGYTWFLQQEIVADYDATVVYCCGAMWAFRLARSEANVDWRLVPDNHLAASWQRIALTPELSSCISEYMRMLSMHYARFDFLVDRDGVWWFLESNFNGQFAWLDSDNSHGLLAHVAACAEQSPADQ